MRLFGKTMGAILTAALIAPVAVTLPTSAGAQSLSAYCQQRAQRISGYNAAGDVVGGAVRGALGGAVVGSLLGSGSRDRRRGARIGAVLGGVSSASRPNSRAARIYRLEYEDCMRRR